MNIAVIIGSLRKESYNRKLYNAYRSLADGDYNFKELSIHKFPLYNQDLEAVNFPEVVESVADRIRESDAVLFFSPEYNYSIPGYVKNAIDWLSRVDDQPFAARPVSILGASPSPSGTARMQYHFRQVGVTLDMRLLNRPEVIVSKVNEKFNEQGDLTDETTRKMLKKHIKMFKEFVSQYHSIEKGREDDGAHKTVQPRHPQRAESEHRA